ncbi:hypothetical protein [Nonomuraea sp. NPDC049400]|uniref:hypothetical protein n=1 Tax=Nonomuraea sp. NPDC049400 TaxID=3364352 RepID=UPI0037AC2F6D
MTRPSPADTPPVELSKDGVAWVDVLRSVDLRQKEIDNAWADLNKRKADLLAQAGFTALEEELKQKQANLDGILEKAAAIFKIEIGADGIGAVDGTPVVKGKQTRKRTFLTDKFFASHQNLQSERDKYTSFGEPKYKLSLLPGAWQERSP